MSASFVRSPQFQPSPASPSRSQFAGSGHLSKQHPDFSQHPLSPPLSVSASHVNASPPSSPQSAVFTPRSAPPMSAQTSQQGFTPASLSPGTHIIHGAQSQDNEGDILMQTESPQRSARTSSKHKMDDEDYLDTEPSKRQRTDHDREDLTAMPASFTPLYKSITSPIIPIRPHPTDDFFGLYSLSSVASSVARTDPITGEKINQLKKSYKGKVKELAGKNNAVSVPGELRGFLEYPDEEWHIQKELGRELVKVDAQGIEDESLDLAEAMAAKLGTALEMQPGKLPGPEHDRWSDFLGYDDLSTAKAAPAVAANKVAKTPTVLPNAINQDGGAAGSTAANQTVRLRRPGAKRHYNEETFEGYSGGFGDDYADSDGDDDRRGPKRKRRKSNPPSTAPSPHFSYATVPPGLSVGTFAGR